MSKLDDDDAFRQNEDLLRKADELIEWGEANPQLIDIAFTAEDFQAFKKERDDLRISSLKVRIASLTRDEAKSLLKKRKRVFVTKYGLVAYNAAVEAIDNEDLWD